MCDKYFIDEQTMRRLIASLDHVPGRDVPQLQRFVAKLVDIKPDDIRYPASCNGQSARQTG